MREILYFVIEEFHKIIVKKNIADKQSLPANTLKYDFIHTHSANIYIKN